VLQASHDLKFTVLKENTTLRNHIHIAFQMKSSDKSNFKTDCISITQINVQTGLLLKSPQIIFFCRFFYILFLTTVKWNRSQSLVVSFSSVLSAKSTVFMNITFGIWIQILAGVRDSSLLQIHPDLLWGPPSLLSMATRSCRYNNRNNVKRLLIP